MQRWVRILLLPVLAGCGFSGAAQAVECADFWEWVDAGCRRVVDTYRNGDNELLVSGFEWHIPATWTPERRAELNQNAWGGGWARTTEGPNGVSESVYFLAFSDSHKNVQFNLGYTWTTYWGERESIQPGLGYTVFILQRPDIAGGVPVPAVLPLFTLRYQKVTLVTSFIPTLNGGINHGSVLYIFGKIALD
jgi:lipid IVA palmitoyltransferase